MQHRQKSTAVVPPCDPNRGNPNFTQIICQNLWFVEQMPQGYRHGEEKRNEMFMMNVTAEEFTYLSGNRMRTRRQARMRDFSRIRLGNSAFLFGTHNPVSPDKKYMPMFGTLSRSQRLAKREKKLMKKTTQVGAVPYEGD